MIGGGFIPLSGDYWQHTQNANQLDTDEGEIEISDVPVRVLQGCMLNADGITATSPTWARLGVVEARHYKEIINIARYNLGYRRFWRIEGTFRGVLYEDGAGLAPLSFHKTYQFADIPQPRNFILVPPLSIDLCKGHVKANFEEVTNPALTENFGPTLNRVINGLIAMVAAEFPGAVLQRYPPDPLMMKLTSTAGDTINTTANSMGEGNSPSLTLNTQFDDGGVHIAYMTIGTDILVNNIFEITINATSKDYTVTDAIEQSDGQQIGDTQEFNYIFKAQ